MTTLINDSILEVKGTSAHLICYLTKELPWDPVMAEDGNVYERTAIEHHIATQKNGVLKSPMTNEPMGERLHPVPTHKIAIEALIKGDDVLQPDLVSKWNEKVKEKKAMEDLIKAANNGDATAMLKVGTNYFCGGNGFKKDAQLANKWLEKSHDAGNGEAAALIGMSYFHCEKDFDVESTYTWLKESHDGYKKDAESAYTWLKKSHDAGHTKTATMLGYLCYSGLGVEQSYVEALYYWTVAAGEGSRLASFWLGEMFAHGCPGVAVDKNKAFRWAWIAVKEDPRGEEVGLWKLNKAKAQELLDGLTGIAN